MGKPDTIPIFPFSEPPVGVSPAGSTITGLISYPTNSNGWPNRPETRVFLEALHLRRAPEKRTPAISWWLFMGSSTSIPWITPGMMSVVAKNQELKVGSSEHRAFPYHATCFFGSPVWVCAALILLMVDSSSPMLQHSSASMRINPKLCWSKHSFRCWSHINLKAFAGLTSFSHIWLVVFRHPSEKYEFVSWGYYSQDMGKKHVPNHQPDMFGAELWTLQISPFSDHFSGHGWVAGRRTRGPPHLWPAWRPLGCHGPTPSGRRCDEKMRNWGFSNSYGISLDIVWL